MLSFIMTENRGFSVGNHWLPCGFPPIFLLHSQTRHSRPHSPRSFWPAAGIESSGLVQHRKSAIHGLPVKSGKSDWLRIRNKIGSGQSSRSLPQARRIVGSGDETANPRAFNRPFHVFYHARVLLPLSFRFSFKSLRFRHTPSRSFICGSPSSTYP